MMTEVAFGSLAWRLLKIRKKRMYIHLSSCINANSLNQVTTITCDAYILLKCVLVKLYFGRNMNVLRIVGLQECHLCLFTSRFYGRVTDNFALHPSGEEAHIAKQREGERVEKSVLREEIVKFIIC